MTIVHKHTGINSGGIETCPCGDNDGRWCSLPGCPYPNRDDNLDRDKADIIAALDYRSGPDSCNSVYLGSMATGMICHAVGIGYGDPVDRREAIRNASREQIDKALEACAGVIAHMKAHPTMTCPTCGTRGITLKETAPIGSRHFLNELERSIDDSAIDALTGQKYINVDACVLASLIADSRTLQRMIAAAESKNGGAL